MEPIETSTKLKMTKENNMAHYSQVLTNYNIKPKDLPQLLGCILNLA